MKNLGIGILFALVAPLAFSADSIVEVPNSAVNQRILKQLDLDYDCMGSDEKNLRFLLNEDAREKFSKRKFFKTQLFQHSITVVEDVQTLTEDITKKKDLGIYHTFEEMEQELQVVAQTQSGLASLKVGAQSHEGRPIYVLEITAKASEREKVNFLVTGTHHARGWISTEVPLAFIKHLTEGYGQDPVVTELLDTSVIVVVPMLNPDGGVHSRTKSTMWRKNRRKPEGNWRTGVDNNRNYPYHFGGAGASGYSGSQTYHGPEALSEIENQLVVQLTEEYGFKAGVSFHSYSELVLWPWGYTSKIQSKDHEIFARFGNEMGKIMKYKPMQASKLYPASGVFDDTMYANYGVLAYTIELGTQFVPREDDVAGIQAKSIEALRYLFTNARNPFGNTQNTPVRKAQRILERLVYHLEDPNNKVEISRDHEELSKFDSELLGKAMNGLKMHPALQDTVVQGMTRHRRHQKLHSAN